MNRASDSLETNARVQECLTTANQAKKLIVRYIQVILLKFPELRQLTIMQLVENEELIGTLIETNDRLMSALEMYNQLIATEPGEETEDTRAIVTGMAAINVGSDTESTIPHENKEKGKDRGLNNHTYIHPDLEDLNFGPLGHSSTNLPPPIQPSALANDGAFEQDSIDRRGSLSDFSDYESSDENTHRANAGPSFKRNYVTVSDNEGESVSSNSRVPIQTHDDPFADPFADA